MTTRGQSSNALSHAWSFPHASFSKIPRRFSRRGCIRKQKNCLRFLLAIHKNRRRSLLRCTCAAVWFPAMQTHGYRLSEKGTCAFFLSMQDGKSICDDYTPVLGMVLFHSCIHRHKSPLLRALAAVVPNQTPASPFCQSRSWNLMEVPGLKGKQTSDARMHASVKHAK